MAMESEHDIEYHKECLKNATTSGNHSVIANSAHYLGNANLFLGEFRKAIDYFEVGVKSCIATENFSGLASHYGNMGTAYYLSGEYTKAIECMENSLPFSDDHSTGALNNGNLGVVYHRIGEYDKAIKYYKRCLEIVTAIGDLSEIARKNYSLGDVYCTIKAYEKAIDCHKLALDTCSETGNQLGIASNCTKLSICYSYLNEDGKAIEFSQRALKESIAIDDRSGIVVNNANLGSFFSNLGEHKKAIYHYKKNLKIHTDTDDRSAMASDNSYLSNAYGSLGEYEKAIDCDKKRLELHTAIGNQHEITNTNCILGAHYLSLGRNEEALHCFKEALKLSTSISYQPGIANSNGNLSNVYLHLGENDKAIDHCKKALKICNAIDDKEGIEKNSSNLGCVYFYIGEYEKAINCFEKSLGIAKEMGNKLSVARVTCNLGETYARLRENEKSISYAKVSLETSTAINNRSLMAKSNGVLGNAYSLLDECGVAIDYYEKNLVLETAMGRKKGIAGACGNLGNAYCRLEEFDKAITYYKKSFEISTSIGDRWLIASINSNLGGIYRKLGEYEKAIELCRTGLQFSADIGDPFLIAISYHNFGMAHQCKEELDAASSYFMKSISTYDGLFLNMVPDQNKISFTGKYFHVHKALMTCFVSSGRKESGLLVIDLGRAKELHFSIEKNQNDLGTELFAYARSIWKKIENREENQELERIQNIFQTENDEISILVFAFDLEKSLNVWILNSDVIFKSLMSGANSKKLVSLISTFFAEISVDVNRYSSFFKLYSLASAHSFDSQMILSPAKPSKGNGLESLHEKNPCVAHSKQETILKELFHLVIQPIRDVVKGKKLIVVPDKQLFFVPFSSLIDENDCYLSQSYSIQVTPSLHTLRFTKEHPHDADLGFALFVGNPKVGMVSLNGTDFIAADLPNAAEEVNCLSKLFEAKPLVGREARKQVVLGLLSGASIIHIAAHGEPKRGEILLAPDVSSKERTFSLPNSDSYLLRQQDITSISLQACLVVLCCCHTGQGVISSEGVIGIARSFLAAGARSVVATLWPISDNATKEFMEAFYAELCQETPVCEALRKAKNLFQNHEKVHYQSVEIWAPFTVYGEDVLLHKHDIEKIREKSRKMSSSFVVLS